LSIVDADGSNATDNNLVGRCKERSRRRLFPIDTRQQSTDFPLKDTSLRPNERQCFNATVNGFLGNKVDAGRMNDE
jgi:hypothetical protein